MTLPTSYYPHSQLSACSYHLSIKAEHSYSSVLYTPCESLGGRKVVLIAAVSYVDLLDYDEYGTDVDDNTDTPRTQISWR